MDDGFRRQIAAYSDMESEDESAAPRFWTPEWVGRRLIEGYRIIDRSTRYPGPRAHANGWPEMVRDYAELIDFERLQDAVLAGSERTEEMIRAAATADIVEQRSKDVDDDVRRRAPPDGFEIELADEALSWSSRHLVGRAVISDALQLWAVCMARGRSIAKELSNRREVAEAKMLVRWQYLKRHHDYKVKRREAEAADWIEPLIVRADVMPNRVFTHQYLNRARKIAASAIAAKLHAEGVEVR